ncbi:MAG: hypothetical protein ABI200_01405 [Gaiellales bacterium]
MNLTQRLLYVMAMIAAALGMIWVASATASKTPLGPSARAKSTDRRPHSLYGARSGDAIINVMGAVPGDSGRGRLVIANAGSKPFRRVRLTQDNADLGGMSGALQLQIFDRTAKRCLYPYTRLKAPIRRGRRSAPRIQRCRGWRSYDSGRRLNNTVVAGARSLTWRPGERHVIEVRWRLTKWSSNDDQNRTAQFRLRWRAYG